MPDRPIDPLDVLFIPTTPLQPDPAFVAALRNRVAQAVDASHAKELRIRAHMTTRPRNGSRHGDVSYITLGLPDLARGRAFYGAVFGWQFSPGASDHGAQVDEVVPMVGLWDGDQPVGPRVHGAVLGFRVDDIGAAVASVRAHGGTIGEPHPEPYGLAAEGHDDQGIPFYLHQMPEAESASASPENGEFPGDVSYLTMVVPDLEAARAFYGALFGWEVAIVRLGGAQVSGVAPQMGMTTRPESGPAMPGVILCYRVDDLTVAVQRVEAAGGRGGALVQRPYGLESLCEDDQGTPFYLHQF